MITFINAIHFTLFASIGYGVYIFYSEHSKGNNRFTYSVLLVLLSALLGELWSITTLLRLWSSEWNQILRVVQLICLQASFLHLGYVSVMLIIAENKIALKEIENKVQPDDDKKARG